MHTNVWEERLFCGEGAMTLPTPSSSASTCSDRPSKMAVVLFGRQCNGSKRGQRRKDGEYRATGAERMERGGEWGGVGVSWA